MVIFERFDNTLLYFVNNESNGGCLAYFLQQAGAAPQTIDINASWNQFIGCYLFLKQKPDEQQLPEFISYLNVYFRQNPISYTSIAWVQDVTVTSILELKLYILVIKSSEGLPLVEHDLELPILGSSFCIEANSPIIADRDSQGDIVGFAIEYSISIKNRPTANPHQNIVVPFSGLLRGCITCQISCFHQSTPEQDQPDIGFYTFIKKEDTREHYASQFYPLMQGQEEPLFVVYQMSWDPVNLYDDQRTHLTFKGYGYRLVSIPERPYQKLEIVQSLALNTYFCTVFGQPIALKPVVDSEYPAQYVLEQLPSDIKKPYYLAPKGDFTLLVPGVQQSYNHYLRCGLSGTEFFKISPQTADQPGDIIRFRSGQPATVLNFPFPAASPVEAPFDPTASPFDDAYVTSWATLINSSGTKLQYVSQPKGATFFGLDHLIEPQFNTLLGHTTTAFEFSHHEGRVFPMLPYAGMQQPSGDFDMSILESEALEETVISPHRRVIVGSMSTTNASQLGETINAEQLKIDTTPSGLLVTTTQSTDGDAVRWDEVLLGWNQVESRRYNMAFKLPSNPLINALQSSDVFLVVANNQNLTGFSNVMGIGGWEMKAEVGENQQYGDYQNVMIFKGRKGKLYDPENKTDSLVANPKKWTQSKDFAVPQIDGGNSGDDAQLIILSQWLQTYFENAFENALENAQDDDSTSYFDKFNQIASSENWTGILFLRVKIEAMPENLKGIIAGVAEPDTFNVHHLGIDISPVEKGVDGPEIKNPSSMFGLIYYLDPDFVDTQPIRSIAPFTPDTYDFRLLSLKVLFANTAVKSFESYSQLTVNELFGATITKTRDPNNIYQNILLAGSLQFNNGSAVYSLSSKNDDAFYLNSNIINKIEINDVVLSTRSGSETDSAGNASNVVCWFGMSGFIDYFSLTNESEETFDVFSFGNKPGEDSLQQGLHFSNLGIHMQYPEETPLSKQLDFDASEMRFNLSTSTPRENSLFLNMVLDLDQLVVGEDDNGPRENGYLDVIPSLRLSGVDRENWYGLRFKLNLGTPGELAGKVNLSAYLLLSWSPSSYEQSAYKTSVNISLPGAGGGARLISLQNVMKLSIGQIRLQYIEEQESFLLQFTEIALRFLGLIELPPGGKTRFYLFGNPKSGEKASGLGWYAMYEKTIQPL